MFVLDYVSHLLRLCKHVGTMTFTGGDPNRGWTVDMTYDSKDQALLTLVKGCLEGKYISI